MQHLHTTDWSESHVLNVINHIPQLSRCGTHVYIATRRGHNAHKHIPFQIKSKHKIMQDSCQSEGNKQKGIKNSKLSSAE